jgi:serine/threonine protein kinase
MWIRESEIKLVKKISSGAYAKVFKGVYKDTPVAIKVLKGSLTEENIVNFKHEFAILRCVYFISFVVGLIIHLFISQIQSPNLVIFYGACIEKKLTMVMEYCPRGTLYHVMKDPNEEIGWKQVLDFFTQTGILNKSY